eukprot:TRINITY_DN21102_c0_g1_i2.p1 TRINITY_DN21102_c0_g1~~TRINITY_DN21102_c0_g1_i2.p1  ORF type:complete len:513 (+),score=82.10 TRINITY_DN21102_c0_g1_i2:160-1698(+)
MAEACLEECFAQCLGGFSQLFRDDKVRLHPGGAAHPQPTLRILTANDVYRPERFAMVRSLALKLFDAQTTTKLVLPGDLLGGSLFATAHRGDSVIDVLNTLHVDYCVLGNHEFDYGAARTRELMSKSDFPWLGSNVRESADGRIFHTARDFDVFEVPLGGAGVKVGVFGLCTPATPELSHPGEDVIFEPPKLHAQRCVEKLREQGCELIIALTHLTLNHDKELAESCSGINVILGGHDHDPFFLVHKGVLIAKCGQNADHLGILDLHLERSDASSPLRTYHSFQFLTTANVPADPAVVCAAERWQKSEGDNEVLCHIGDVALSSRTQELRTQENAFGCLVADAIKWSYREQACQGAVQNGGFIRQDASYPPHTTLTAMQVKEEMPFPKRPVLLCLRGSELRRGLEEMLSGTPTPVGSFPQLSQGFSMDYCPKARAFEKIQRLQIDGVDVDAEKEYLIAISEFYAGAAGDGVEAFAKGRQICRHDKLIRDITVEYFRLLGTVCGAVPGRLRPR